MSINCLLRRASNNSGVRWIVADTRGNFLKHYSQYRKLASFQAVNYKVNSATATGPRLFSACVSSHTNVNVEVYKKSLFSKRCCWILQDRSFSSQSQPSPKQSTSTLGLADQVLRTSAAREEKEAEKAKEEEESKKDQEKQVRAVKFTLMMFAGLFVGTGMYIFLVYGAPQVDQSGRLMRDQFSDLPYFQQQSKRAMAELRGMVTMVTSPSREKLLPDPVKHPYHQPPYTLLIELTGVLVHPDWTYKTGWRFKKRPGVDYFLNQINGYVFEIVIYTSEQGFTAFPIIDALDTQNVIHYRLFRDSTQYNNGVHVKDLDKLNRDLSKVIVVEWNEKSVKEHRNNAIILPRWKGNDDDRTLFDLAALLQTIGTSSIEDVRGVLEYYSKFDDPIAEFRKKQQELAQREQEKGTDKSPGPAFNPASGWLGSLFRKN